MGGDVLVSRGDLGVLYEQVGNGRSKELSIQGYMAQKITLKTLLENQPHTRLAKRYGITEYQLRELYKMLYTDFSLGKHKYARGAMKFNRMTGKNLTPRQVRHLFIVIENYENAYKKLERGGHIVDRLCDVLYHNS